MRDVIQFVTPVRFKDLSLEYMKDSDSTKKNPPWEYQIMSRSANSPLPTKHRESDMIGHAVLWFRM